MSGGPAVAGSSPDCGETRRHVVGRPVDAPVEPGASNRVGPQSAAEVSAGCTVSTVGWPAGAMRTRWRRYSQEVAPQYCRGRRTAAAVAAIRPNVQPGWARQPSRGRRLGFANALRRPVRCLPRFRGMAGSFVRRARSGGGRDAAGDQHVVRCGGRHGGVERQVGGHVCVEERAVVGFGVPDRGEDEPCGG